MTVTILAVVFQGRPATQSHLTIIHIFGIETYHRNRTEQIIWRIFLSILSVPEYVSWDDYGDMITVGLSLCVFSIQICPSHVHQIPIVFRSKIPSCSHHLPMIFHYIPIWASYSNLTTTSP